MIQMTRAEYAAKYGSAPTATPVKMTRAQYEEKYGTPPPGGSSTASKQSNVLFPASDTDSALTAGLKATGNTPQSAFNFLKGIISGLNPVNTVKNIAQVPGEFSALSQQTGGMTSALAATAKELPGAAYEGLIPQGIRQILSGDISGAGKTFTEDPFGQAAPAVLAALGGAKVVDKTMGTKISPALDKGVTKTGQLVTKPAAAAASQAAALSKTLTRSAASQLTAMEPQTISQVIADPKAFSKVAQDQVSRGGIANEVGTAIDTLESNLSQTGKGYNAIRDSAYTTKLPPKFVDTVLGEYGLKVNKGKIVADTNSITRNTADINALQNLYDNWGSKQYLTSREFLNFRADLGQLSKFDSAKSGAADTVGKDMYGKLNEVARPQIPGLEAADDAYKLQIEQMNQIKKDYLRKDTTGEWVFKDGAVNKIANLTGPGKGEILARLEALVPGVTKQIQILKAVEDIARAKGIKVGTYTRGTIFTGAVLTGNIIPGIIAAIVTNPTVAVPIIRASSLSGSALLPILKSLKTIGGDINSFKKPSLKK